MKYLLDTNIFVWYIEGNPKLPEHHKRYIENPQNDAYLSVVSVWEAMIKQQLGKLNLPEPAAEYFPRMRERHKITSLVLDEKAIKQLNNLPLLHRDPFDRILICQALANDMILLATDEKITKYSVRVE